MNVEGVLRQADRKVPEMVIPLLFDRCDLCGRASRLSKLALPVRAVVCRPIMASRGGWLLRRV